MFDKLIGYLADRIIQHLMDRLKNDPAFADHFVGRIIDLAGVQGRFNNIVDTARQQTRLFNESVSERFSTLEERLRVDTTSTVEMTRRQMNELRDQVRAQFTTMEVDLQKNIEEAVGKTVKDLGGVKQILSNRPNTRNNRR